ncbi:MAG: ASCH domain-containing protein [Mycoplasma sp.]|nr:ASCH domain-containing protein [Mycoplasma sp.]
MKNNIVLISIMPKYVKQILNGNKKFEYRKSIPKNKFDTILIYSTVPDKKIVAIAKVEKTLKLSIKELWYTTKKYGGISKKNFFEYFKNRKIGYAYKLGKIKKINKFISDINIKHPPQNFMYVKFNKLNELGVHI